MMSCRLVKVVPLIFFTLLISGCAPKGPVQGSPEWLFLAARETFLAGDFEKTADHLEKIEKLGNNPFVERARAWRMVLTAGLANAHLETAQAYADGWTYTRTNKTDFLRQKTDRLKQARRHAIHLVEAYDAFVKDSSDQPVVLEFPFPKGSAAQVTEMDRIAKGMTIAEELRSTAHEKMINRGLVRAVGAVLTTADDSAGAQNAMKTGKAEVPRARFLLATAAALEKLTAVFERKGLDEPDELKIFRERAQDAVKRTLALKPDATTETAAKKLQADLVKAAKAGASKRR